LGNPPSAGPRSKAASALILKLLSASQHWQQTSHKKTKKLNVLEFNVQHNLSLVGLSGNELMDGL